MILHIIFVVNEVNIEKSVKIGVKIKTPNINPLVSTEINSVIRNPSNKVIAKSNCWNHIFL